MCYMGHDIWSICEYSKREATKKLQWEAEKKLEEQFGFRERRGTIDTIYTLKYAINKKITKKKRKVYSISSCTLKQNSIWKNVKHRKMK